MKNSTFSALLQTVFINAVHLLSETLWNFLAAVRIGFLFKCCLLCVLGPILFPAVPGAAQELPPLHAPGAPYRTPRAGEGFRTEVLGQEVLVPPRNRRTTTAWDFSLAFYEPPPQDTEIIPVGVVMLWDHPDDNRLFRGSLSGFYNEIFWSSAFSGLPPFEQVLTFENFTVPFSQSELADGRSIDSEELVWGYVRPGFGLGCRRQVSPGHQDNMAAVDLTIEPGFLYFNKGKKTADTFVVPRDSFDLRAHLQLRIDRLERNLLELPHRGVAAGADLVYGYRTHWENWGVNGAEAAAKGRDYESLTAYFLFTGGLPGIASDRHRLIGVAHVGTGHDLDRFSAPRVGGGPNPIGEEYGSTAYPVLPGAAIQEFYPDHYLLLTGEYRWEPVFFAYWGLNATVGRLDRFRMNGSESIKKTDTFTAVGSRLTTGFFFHTRLQITYNYNFSVVRDGRYGGQEIILNMARNF